MIMNAKQAQKFTDLFYIFIGDVVKNNKFSPKFLKARDIIEEKLNDILVDEAGESVWGVLTGMYKEEYEKKK